ncbi:hypothetical protein COMA1_10209 [Candidatus Nitrospira nitrosa]|uniref:Uncharacterized protein n=1 Tax=Candidatus Nitrospira nitrosa TaxID=1742972 RepID=A0A0S4L4E6_9BACT|nr:hypothetical protein COMA1_10209 [Candidatus Nitrospira nitrosa]
MLPFAHRHSILCPGYEPSHVVVIFYETPLRAISTSHSHCIRYLQPDVVE